MPRLAVKVAKPYPTFPLFAHGNGSWVKKIAGKFRSFGPVRWPDGYDQSWRDALDAYHAHLEAEKRGAAIAIDPTSLDLETLANGFLTHKHGQALKGDIKPRTFAEIRQWVTEYRDALGKRTTVAELERSPKPIHDYIATLDQRFGFHVYNRANQYLRSLWNWAKSAEADLLPRPFKWATLHAKKADKHFRRQRRQERAAGVMSSFDVEEVRVMIEHAKPFTRAQILLGYFAGYGNTDIAEFPDNALRVYEKDETFLLHGRRETIPAGWALIDFPRPKTEIDRCAIVPPMVVAAIDAVRALKRPVASADERHLLFRTEGGRALVYDTVHRDSDGLIAKTTPTDNVAARFAPLVKQLGRCKAHGWVRRRLYVRDKTVSCPICGAAIEPMAERGFYCLRHTATTFAAGSGASSDTRNLFEGHGGGGVRQAFYLDPTKLHDLLLIARDLLHRLTETSDSPAPSTPATQGASPASAA